MSALLARALARAVAQAAGKGLTTASSSAYASLQHLATATPPMTRGFAAQAAAAAAEGAMTPATPDAASSPGRGRRRASSPPPAPSSSNNDKAGGGGRRRRQADSHPAPRYPSSYTRPGGSIFSPLFQEHLQALSGTFPVRVAPSLDGALDARAWGGSGFGGGSGDSNNSNSNNSSLRAVSDVMSRALARGPDGVMLATRSDVVAFLGFKGGEGGLAAAVKAARRRAARADLAAAAAAAETADGEEAETDAADADDDDDADDPSSFSYSLSSSTPPMLPKSSLGPVLSVPELDFDFRPVAWWVALPSAAARRRAVEGCDGRCLGAGGPCRVTPGTPSEMVLASRGGWNLAGRIAARAGGRAVLLRGLPSGGGSGEGAGAAATPAATATSVRAALLAAGLELRRSRSPVRMMVRSVRGRWKLLDEVEDDAVEEEVEEQEQEQEEEEEDEDEDKAAAAVAEKGGKKSGKRGAAAEAAAPPKVESGQPAKERAAFVWMASADEARRCERELHGRPLPLAGGSAGAAPVVSVAVLP